MKQSEMTEEQLKNRAKFVDILTKACWNIGGWEILFQSGIILTPEAQAENQITDFDLQLNYYIQEGYIELIVVGRNNPITSILRFYPKNSIEEVVNKIVSLQAMLSPNMYAHFVKEMTYECTNVLLETPEGLIKISF